MNILSSAVYIRAVDWGFYDGQLSPGETIDHVTADVVGVIIHEDEQRIVLAQQVFMDGGARKILSIPKVCIQIRRDLVFANPH